MTALTVALRQRLQNGAQICTLNLQNAETLDEILARIQSLSRFTLYAVTDAAIARHAVLRRMKLNVGRNDLRLAALALELNATVVTDNIRDFGRVPGLLWADWTK